MKKAIPLLLLFNLFSGIAYSQFFNLQMAQDAYDNGAYDFALNFLNTEEKGARTFSQLPKSDKEKVLILLTQIYIEKQDYHEVNKALTLLYKNNPNYKPTTGIYQEDFYRYAKTLKVRPVFSAGVKAGLGFPHFSIKKNYAVYDSTDYTTPYKAQRGYCYTGYLQSNFENNFALILDYSYCKIGYSRTIERNGSDNFSLNYSEIIYNNDFGLLLKKYLFKNETKLFGDQTIKHTGSGPYLAIGGYYSKMRQAQANVELNFDYIERQNQYIEPKNITRNNIDVKDMRNKNRFGISGAIGSSLTIDRFVISLEGKYLYDITELTNPEKRYTNDELLLNYYYIDNDVSMSRIDVSLSLAYIFSYKVKSKIK